MPHVLPIFEPLKGAAWEVRPAMSPPSEALDWRGGGPEGLGLPPQADQRPPFSRAVNVTGIRSNAP